MLRRPPHLRCRRLRCLARLLPTRRAFGFAATLEGRRWPVAEALAQLLLVQRLAFGPLHLRLSQRRPRLQRIAAQRCARP